MAPKVTQKAPPKSTKAKAHPKKQSAPQPQPPPQPTKRQRSSPDSPSPPTPEWDKGITSQASRKRAQFRLSRVSFQDDLDENYIQREAAKLSKESANIWGSIEQSPIRGSRRPKAHCRALKKGRSGTVGMEEVYMEMFNAMMPKRREPEENCLDRTPILRIPLEIRERIYSYLLTYPDPIMVKDDWRSIERGIFKSHSVMLVCKKFAFEASSLLYRNNTFRTLIRKPSSNVLLRYETPAKLPSFAHSLFRNIIIDCSKRCWNLNWHENVAEGLETLAKAKPTIDTLTLVVVPQRVGMSHTALGIEVCPVTFADFLYHTGPFMRAIFRIAPKTFKIVVKKSRKLKLGIEVDLTYLRIWNREDEGVANEETLRVRKMGVRGLREEVKGLKERFEEVFEDHEGALREGLCRLICPREMRRDAVRGFEGMGRSGDGGGAAEDDEGERGESEKIWVF